MKKSAPSFKFLLTLGLAVSLSGCAGSGFGTWNNNWNNSWNNNNWNNITGGVRNYGQYPTPNEETCFINPTLGNDIQQGLYNLEFQKAKQGIPGFVLVKNYLIPATNKLFVEGNAQSLNALYAQIQPQTLANFMIGCNEVMVQERQQLIQERQQLVQGYKTLVQERQQLIQERQQLIQDVNNLSNKIATLQQYLNTTPAPQPTFETSLDSYVYAHPEITKAEDTIAEIYEGKPALLYLKLILYTPHQPALLEKLLNIRTLQELQNFQQQLQKDHLLTDGVIPSVPSLPPPPPPPLNFNQYKLTLTSIEHMKETTAQIEQATRKVYQKLQKVHQQLQKVHQQLQGVHQLSQQAHLGPQEIGSFRTPQEILNTVESIHLPGLPPPPGLSGIINYEKAVIAAQNGNYMPLIKIEKQVQPQTWRNYFVNYYKLGQKYHQKAKVRD